MSTYYYRTRGEGEGAGHPVDSALSSQTAIYRDHLGEFAKQSVTLQSIHSPFPAVLPSDSFGWILLRGSPVVLEVAVLTAVHQGLDRIYTGEQNQVKFWQLHHT